MRLKHYNYCALICILCLLVGHCKGYDDAKYLYDHISWDMGVMLENCEQHVADLKKQLEEAEEELREINDVSK